MNKFVIVSDADNYLPGYLVVRFRDDPKDYANELCLKAEELPDLYAAVREAMGMTPALTLKPEAVKRIAEKLKEQTAPGTLHVGPPAATVSDPQELLRRWEAAEGLKGKSKEELRAIGESALKGSKLPAQELPSPDIRHEIRDLREQLIAQDARILRMEQAEARRRSIENVNNYPPPGVTAVPSPFVLSSGPKLS